MYVGVIVTLFGEEELLYICNSPTPAQTPTGLSEESVPHDSVVVAYYSVEPASC